MKKIFLILTLFCITFPQLAFGGAWTLPKNNIWAEFYMKGNWSKYDFGSDRSLNRKDNGAFSYGMSIAPKIEYGLTDWITILGSFEYKEAHYKEYNRRSWWGPHRRKSHALTTVDFGTRVRFMEDPFVLSGQIKGILYTGDGKNKDPGLCDGNDAIDIRGLIGKKFDWQIPCYLGAESGYRFKNRHVANDIPFFVEGGFWPFKWLLLKTEVDGYFSHGSTGSIKKEYAIWRIGPVFQL
ncbi:MAG: hypothetical protein ABIH85_00780, partial [Candidatus Omnitrophota bacterium]